jgi:uncharacterized protein YidB (DUF937 family)
MLGGKSGGSTTKKKGKAGAGASTGLEALIAALTAGGLADIVGSWIGKGPNKPITPAQVKKGVGAKKLAELSAQSGMPVNEVAKHLSTLLPGLVNHLTPDGTVPEASSLEASLQGLQGLLPKF